MILPKNLRLFCLLFSATSAMALIGCQTTSRGERALDVPAVRVVQTDVVSPTLSQNPPLRFRITDLGTLGDSSWAKAINNNSQIVGGTGKTGYDTVIFLWQKGVLREIGPLPNKLRNSPNDINNRGNIVGWASNRGTPPNDPSIAFWWRNGKIEPLFPDTRNSGAAAINDKDQIVGYMSVEGEKDHAFLWEAGRVADLGTLSGGSSWAVDINTSGQIVGRSDFGVRSLHGFLWEKGKMRDLGTLGGSTTEARGINDSAQVVGVSHTASEQCHAFLWEKGVMHDLGSPGPGLCIAAKINNKDTVVGDWWPEKTSYKGARALVWIDRKMYDLNDLIPNGSGWVLEAAIAINDKEEIVGKGKHNGDERAFLLTPVPKKAP